MGALIRAKLGILKAGVALAKGFDEEKHPRGKKGTPQGGKFVPKDGHDLLGNPHDLYPGEDAGAGTEHGKWWESWFGGDKHADHEAAPSPKGPPPHSFPKPGAIEHPKTDDKGYPVFIRKPTPEGDPAAWHDPSAVATAIPGGHVPESLHGVATNTKWTPPATHEGWANVSGQNPKLDEGLPDLSTLDPHLRPAAGVIIEEPDGRVWITRPTNSFGGYHHTFPKGGTEPGHSLQATAIKEAYEETGMKVKITGVVGDFKRTTSVARYYTAQREGGTPADMGWESQAMRLVPKDRLPRMLNVPVDHDILDTYLAEYHPHDDRIKKSAPPLPSGASFATLMMLCADPEGEARLDAVEKMIALEARIAKSVTFDESKHPRGAKGTHEGGKFVSSGTSVMFEVAPDPNDKALTDRWNELPEEAKLQISKEVAADVLPDALKRLNAHGTLAEQIGGYMGQTNPSLALSIDPRNAVPAAKLLGHALSQDSMMVVSAKPATGLDPVGVVAVKLPAHERDIKSIAAIHEKLYALKGEDGHPLVGGFTAANGRLEILNFSGLPDERLASIVDRALDAKYQVHHTTAYAAFVEKKDYGYAGNAVAEGRAASVRGGGQGGIRAAATAALQRHLQEWEARGHRRIVKSSGWDESKHPRWPKGSPLAGQFMNVDEHGYTKPPVIGGGKTNPQYDKQAAAYYTLAHAGKWQQLQAALDKVKGQLQAKANKVAAGNGKIISHDKWKAKLLQYGEQLQADHAKLQTLNAKADKLSGPDVLGDYKKIGPKPGGSNPGALYTDKAGKKVLVKGNNAFIQGSYGADVNTMRAQNEVLASKLLQAAGAGVPDAKLVALGKEHGGGTGVAVTWMDGLKKLDPNNPAHLSAARADFAAHAWLANYDVIGMGKDNTAIAPNGKAVNVDPGGALLFRAQGQFKNELQSPNGILNHNPIEWDSLRHKTAGAPANPDAWHIYGGMTDSELKSSASKLSVMSDDKIKELVNTYGPGSKAAKANLAESLIARRDAIMAKSGLKPAGNGVFTVAAGHSVASETPGNAVKHPETSGNTSEHKHMQAAKPTPPASVDHPSAGTLPKLYANNITSQLNLIDKKGATPGAIAELTDVGQSLDLKASGYGAGTPVGQAWKDVYEYHKQAVAYAEAKLAATPAPSTATGGGRLKPPAYKADGADKIKPHNFESQIAAVNSFVADGDADGLAKIIHNTKNGATYSTLTGTDKVNADAVIAYGEAKWKEMTGELAPSHIVKPTFTGASASYYDKHAENMINLHNAGDLQGLKAAINKPTGEPLWGKQAKADGSPKAANGVKIKSLHDDLVANLSAKQAAHVEAAVEAVQKPVEAIHPGEKKGANPAMPNFDSHLLPPTNTNAGSHNKKVADIMHAAAQGDAKAILAMKFGTNTYGKKQVQLANDTLAAMGVHDIMGVPAKVVAGQKANSHPALTGGVKPDVAMAVMQAAGKKIDADAMLPAKGKASPALTDKDLPPPYNFLNWQGQGKGLSSSEHYNKSNQATADNLVAMAKAGDLNGVKTATYQPVDKATGAPIGVPQPVSNHPSQHIQNLHNTLVDTMEEKANPPSPLELFKAQQAAASVQALSAQFPPKPFGTHAGQVDSSKTIGHYIALGQVKKFDDLVPSKTMPVSEKAKVQAKHDYALMSANAKKFVSVIQGHGGLDYWEKNWGKSYSASELTAMAKAAHEYSRKQPPGTKIYKWDNLTPDMKKKLSLAQPGLILQNPAPQCASYSPTATKSFGPSHRFNIIFASGARTVSTFGSGGYAQEGELTLLPNHRFMVLDHKKAGANGHDYAETTVLLLPPDPSLGDAKLAH